MSVKTLLCKVHAAQYMDAEQNPMYGAAGVEQYYSAASCTGISAGTLSE